MKLLQYALNGGKTKIKYHLNFSEDSQLISEIYSYKPPLPIQYVGFSFNTSRIVNSELALLVTVSSLLCIATSARYEK